MSTSKTLYLKNLRTESIHTKSGEKIISDAPTDNYGKGESFSPTDLLATSLTKCMITIMGIYGNNNGIELEYAEAETTKIMESIPRRVGEIKINLGLKISPDNEANRTKMKTAGLACPVAKSLHPDILQTIHFEFK
ncbi:MAG: OsmC family protein [Flavobacteriales bacterium]